MATTQKVSRDPSPGPSITGQVIEQAKAFGASLAGVAAISALHDSPSHAARGGAEWPAEVESALVVALAHPVSEPELDWWDFKAGGNPGNRRLIEIADNLVGWLTEEHDITAHPAPYQVSDGGTFLKDAAALAGLGVVGRNNLLITPTFGPRVRLRAVFLETALEPTGPRDFAPCEDCDMPCRLACPTKAFFSGAYNRTLCNFQMVADEAKRALVKPWGNKASPVTVVKYCRACELACPVGR